ncbi:MAG: sigma-70 family RNA polymerase sigma factor [Actinobacteria bacterium]|nr:MAG: sigma-70 family RNA polymerase sigma factor [Actinomycetota bacterium]
MHDPALPIRSPPELGVPVGLSSDERLAKLVSNGSARAFGLLYRRHHQALYRYCCAIVRNADDAQDALQSAMLRALVALQAEQRDLAVRPWLFRIAHNEAVSLLRRRRVAVPLAGELEPSEAAAEHTWEIRERIATLVVDLQALTERQRSALVMHELSGLPIKEIAVALSISPGAAKQALFEARCALQEFDEGRAMDCEAVRRVVSDGDRRVLHGRKIRGHLRSCQGCRDFRRTIGERQAAWSALAPPLPAAAASAMLARLLAQAVDGGHVGGAAAASGIAVGKPGAASVAAKVLACAAVVTVTATGGARLVLQPSHHPHAKPPAPAAGRSSGVSLAAGTLPGRQSSGSVVPTPARGTTRSGRAAGASPSGAGTVSPATPSTGATQPSRALGRSSAGLRGRGPSASGRGHRHRGHPAVGRRHSRRLIPASRGKALPAHPSRPNSATAPRREPRSGVTEPKGSGGAVLGVTGSSYLKPG